MNDVYIAGIGQIPVGEHWETSLRSLAAQAVIAARREAPTLTPEAVYIGNSLGSSISHQANLGALITDWTNLTGAEGTTTEAGGASGGAALRLGYLAVRSGVVKTALVLGVEKVTDTTGRTLHPAMVQGMDLDYEAMSGLTPAGLAALMHQRYLHQYAPPTDAFSGFALNSYTNSVHNPYARYRKAIKPETYAGSEISTAPMRLYDESQPADGAAAVILTALEDLPRESGFPRVRISGSNLSIDTLALHDRPDPLNFQAASLSTGRALRQAKRSMDQIDFFELDDAYSIYTVIALESAGLAPRGRGWDLALKGEIRREGKMPICTMGGSKARGNPLGAVGVYQAVEAVLQLRGAAGANQVANARVGMIQCWGGPASTVATHILERVED